MKTLATLDEISASVYPSVISTSAAHESVSKEFPPLKIQNKFDQRQTKNRLFSCSLKTN